MSRRESIRSKRDSSELEDAESPTRKKATPAKLPPLTEEQIKARFEGIYTPYSFPNPTVIVICVSIFSCQYVQDHFKFNITLVSLCTITINLFLALNNNLYYDYVMYDMLTTEFQIYLEVV